MILSAGGEIRNAIYTAHLLAAGEGRRMGGVAKPLITLQGVPLISRQLVALSGAGVDEVVVVTGHARHAVEVEPEAVHMELPGARQGKAPAALQAVAATATRSAGGRQLPASRRSSTPPRQASPAPHPQSDAVGRPPHQHAPAGACGLVELVHLERDLADVPELGQFWGGNVLRVLGAAQKARIGAREEWLDLRRHSRRLDHRSRRLHPRASRGLRYPSRRARVHDAGDMTARTEYELDSTSK